MNPISFHHLHPAFRSSIVKLLLCLCLPSVVHAQFVFVTNNNAITITSFNGTSPNVVIPATTNGFKVTKIANLAFGQVDTMTNVIIGTNLTTIGTNAFYQCHNLASATIPVSVTNIGDGPFYDCQKMTNIVAFTNAFYSATNGYLMNRAHTALIQVPGGMPGSFTIAAAVTSISLALIGNTLTNITVDPANTIYFGTNGVLFSKNKSQLIEYPGGLGGSYSVPTNVTLIVSASFEYAPAIAAVSIPTNVTSIGLFAFFDCTALTNITVATANQFYRSTNGVLLDRKKITLIQYPAGLAGDYVIPNTVSNVAIGAFGNAVHLTSVMIPDSVTNLDVQSFFGCQGLTGVLLGNNVKTIGVDAFFLCTSLSSIIFPNSVTNIGFNAFGGCFALSSVCFQGKPPTDGGSIFAFDNALTSILFVTGNPGWGATYDGITTAPCTTCTPSAPTGPILSITRTGTNVFLKWPSSFTGYNLEFTTNLAPLSPWKTNTPAAVIINSQFVASNSISGTTKKYYRLIQ